MLNLDNLRIFVVAAETENFSRAAEQLHMSQPAVSQHMATLEQQLGVELFDRSGRHVAISAAGQALLPLARDLINRSKQVEEAALVLKGEVSGRLTIGCSTTSGKYVLPRLLARYREHYPLVRATVKVGARQQMIDWLVEGDVDVGVASERVARGGLSYQRFFEDEIVLLVPGSHRWASRGSVSPAELQGERFVMREAVAGTNLTVLEALTLAGVDVQCLEVVLTLENSEAIVMAIEEEIGLGFVPRVAVERFVALGRVAALQVDGLDLRRWLYMIDNLHRPQTPALQTFWEYMAGESGKAQWPGLLPIPAQPWTERRPVGVGTGCD